MAMEMEMRSTKDIEISKDITPKLTPLSFSLHNSHLQTHCSSCFSPIPNPNPLKSFSYCSLPCSTAHSSILLSSAEHHLHPSTTSSLLRTALRLNLPSLSSDRVANLLSNRHKLTCQNDDVSDTLRSLSSDRVASLLSNRHKLTCQNDDVSDTLRSLSSDRVANLLSNRHKLTCQNDDVSDSIRTNARAMADAIAKMNGDCFSAALEDATVALCVVLTNAVEVIDSEGCAVGIAVFEPGFSWINHSCCPNACYRFVFSYSSSVDSEEEKLCIAPFSRNSQQQSQMDSGSCSISISHSNSSELAKSKEGELRCGPRLIVRSIKRIKKGEEVTVAYTDLLQPKAVRQSELWSKYRFICCCERCSSLPFTYVDHALQEISVFCRDSSGLSNYEFFRDMADSRLTECIDDVISEYLSDGDSESCCEKLEKILTQGMDEQLEGIEGQSHPKFILHPLNHLSLNAYTTLASAYKVRANDLLSVNSETDLNLLQAFEMSKTSAAYSLLLAGAAHHLFNFESSLIASAANFWASAGESLLSLIRNSRLSKSVKLGFVDSNLSSVAKFEYSKCSVMDRFRACLSNGQIIDADFENVSNEFLHCISDITRKVWSFLVSDCQFLRSCKDPINFSWPMSPKTFTESEKSICIFGEEAYNDHTVAHIFQLSGHCIAYGGLLATICYGPHSHLACHVQHLLDGEKNFEM